MDLFDSKSLLVCGANWLGDAVMSMPALQAFHERAPSCRMAMLCRDTLAPLWETHPCISEVIPFRPMVNDTFAVASKVASLHLEASVSFPNSFRSAFIPFRAGIPKRVGAVGHFRSWMLTDIIDTAGSEPHQVWEYMRLLGLSGDIKEVPSPTLALPESVCAGYADRLQGTWAALVPGAARGPSKRWPAERFAEVGRQLLEGGCDGIVALGTAEEHELCATALAVKGNVLNLAGETSLVELAAVLGACRVAVVNDSGGMHLATAVGTPVVAIYGVTDPAKTGPMGEGHHVVQPEGIAGSRDVPRDSEEAQAALEQVAPETVARLALEVCRRTSHEDKR